VRHVDWRCLSSLIQDYKVLGLALHKFAAKTGGCIMPRHPPNSALSACFEVIKDVISGRCRLVCIGLLSEDHDQIMHLCEWTILGCVSECVFWDVFIYMCYSYVVQICYVYMLELCKVNCVSRPLAVWCSRTGRLPASEALMV